MEYSIAICKGQCKQTGRLRDTSLTTSATGAIVASVKYFPYGVWRNSQGNLDTDKLFTGQRLDDTGLYYYNARYYDATIGRFISADTYVQDPTNPQTLNRYSYCLNNPLKYIDPSGHSWWNPLDWGKSIGNFLWGVGEGIWDTGKAIVTAVTHPAETFKAIQYAFSHQWETVTAIGNEFLNNCQTSRGIGNNVGNIIASFAAGGIAGKAGQGAGNLVAKVSSTLASKVPRALPGFMRIGTGGGEAGTALAARLGAEGEAAVRSIADIGPKTAIKIGDKTRVVDGLTTTTLTEVKNVGYQAYTSQLRDYAAYAGNNLQFNLWVRYDTILSGPLKAARDNGIINVIPLLPPR